MRLLSELFSSDSGRASIAGIVFMLGMGVFFIRFFWRKMEEEEALAKQKKIQK
jgi:hypothetical protein